MFPWVAKLGNIPIGSKICVCEQNCFWLDSETFSCFEDAKFASATYVSRAAKLGNVCVCSNVSATRFPSLARPLRPRKSSRRRFAQLNKQKQNKDGVDYWVLNLSALFRRASLYIYPSKKLIENYVFLISQRKPTSLWQRTRLNWKTRFRLRWERLLKLSRRI